MNRSRKVHYESIKGRHKYFSLSGVVESREVTLGSGI
jgi:hypothetical protein